MIANMSQLKRECHLFIDFTYQLDNHLFSSLYINPETKQNQITINADNSHNGKATFD
ncbi:unnamed protein product, partial [Vitis vinifera]|uniref:Uncharacterized protein n=1 Tax=Vitis vinifera TaxID=29760 RepID=D7TKZ9_VITVI